MLGLEQLSASSVNLGTSPRGDGANEMGDNRSVVDLGTGKTAVAISVGDDHNCALLSDGGVKCWGGNSYGQLGQGDTLTRGLAPGQVDMGDLLPAIALGTGEIVVGIRAGEQHTCALLIQGRMKCWGWGESGRLGLGDTANRGDQPNEMGNQLPYTEL